MHRRRKRKILQKEKRLNAKEIKERKEELGGDRVSCPGNVVFGGGGGGDGFAKAEGEEMLQMMMNYHGRWWWWWCEWFVCRNTPSTTRRRRKEEGEEGSEFEACGFDPLKTEYERSVVEAFQTIRV